MFGITKKNFIVLLTKTVKKCMFLSTKKLKIQPTLSNLHSYEYTQELHYYPFAIKLDKCVRSWNTLNNLSNNLNTLNNLSNKVCVPNKTEDVNIRVFNIIRGKMQQKF